MPVPENLDVKVVENEENCVHIILPAAPSISGKLSDEELSNAAGGCIMTNVPLCLFPTLPDA